MESFTYKDARISFIGHAAFKINIGTIVLYTDPFRIPDKMPPADIILVSHGHYDHCDSTDIEKISSESTIIITTEEAKRKLKENVHLIAQKQKLVIKGITIESIPAYNKDRPYHPPGVGIGFIIDTGKSRIYFAGDTDYTEEMEKLKNIDVCLVPISGTYTMDEKEAANFVNDIKPHVAIPMHYGNIAQGNPVEFKRLTDPSIDVHIMA